MNERPILMSAPMVRAILDGKKSQTRRAVKPQPVSVQYTTDGKPFGWFDDIGHEGRPLINRYGQPGDRLWVKETFAVCPPEQDAPAASWCIRYRATPDEPIHWRDTGGRYDDDEINGKWHPSIFMSREYSRITLEITEVRVERVQDMKLADVAAEGIPRPARGETWDGAVGDYMSLWDSINAKCGYGWNLNPWVWVVSFQRVTP